MMYLSQNFFNPTVQNLLIDYRVNNPGQVRICVFTMYGSEVIKLVDSYHAAGNYQVPWNGRNTSGDMVGNALYLVVIQSPDGHMSLPGIVLK